jgi:hypothetical protein
MDDRFCPMSAASSRNSCGNGIRAGGGHREAAIPHPERVQGRFNCALIPIEVAPLFLGRRIFDQIIEKPLFHFSDKSLQFYDGQQCNPE